MKIYAGQKNFRSAISESKFALHYLRETPLHLARHHGEKADIQINQDSLYGALESIDKALKICALNGLSEQELEYLGKKIDILRLNKLERSAIDVATLLIDKKTSLSSDQLDMLLESLNYKSELEINKKKLIYARSRELILLI